MKEVYRIEKRFTFEASHRLPKHDGKCSRLHGHSWAIIVEVEGTNLVADGPKEDMLIDYGDVSEVTKSLIEGYLDHYHLNDSTGLKNPTSEALARWVYWRLEPRIRTLRAEEAVKLASVRIEETCTSACTFRVEASIETSSKPQWTGNIRRPILSPGDRPALKKGR